MGLDTIELVVRIETEFDVQILDAEAERMVTIQDIADGIAAKKAARVGQPNLQVQEQVRDELRKLFPEQSAFSIHDELGEVIPDGQLQSTWSKLAERTGLRFPTLRALDLQNAPRTRIGIGRFQLRKAKEPISRSTVAELVDFVVSLNYRMMIDTRTTTNIYEIERAMLGLMSEVAGISIQELKLSDSITDDLGLD